MIFPPGTDTGERENFFHLFVLLKEPFHKQSWLRNFSFPFIHWTLDFFSCWLYDRDIYIRFHDLRHSFAAISLQNGDDIKTVSENLGHATVAFTLDVYGHVTDKMKKDSADRMQAYISSL